MGQSAWALYQLESLVGGRASSAAGEGDRYLHEFEKYLQARIPNHADVVRNTYKNLYHTLSNLGWRRYATPRGVEVKSMSGPSEISGDVHFLVLEPYSIDLGKIVDGIFKSIPNQVLKDAEPQIRRPPDIFGVLVDAVAGFAQDYWQQGRAGFDHLGKLANAQPMMGHWKKLTGGNHPHVMKYDVSVSKNRAMDHYPTAGIVAYWTGALQAEESPKTWNPGPEDERHQPLIPRRP